MFFSHSCACLACSKQQTSLKVQELSLANALPTKVGQKRQKVQNGIVTDAIYIRDQQSQHWIRAAGLSYRVSTAKHLRSNSQKSILRVTQHCVKELGEVISRGKQTFTTGNSQLT